MIARWPKYAAKLLPDVEQLADTYEIDHEERNVKQEEYAQGVLLMFHPFRKLEGITRSILRLRSTFQLHTDVRRRTHPTADILDSGTTWWESYIARHDLHSDPDTASTLKSMQNFYESFCPSQNVTELLETQYTDVEPVPREDRATDGFDVDEHEFPLVDDDDNENFIENISANALVRQLAATLTSIRSFDLKSWLVTIPPLHASQAIAESTNERQESKCHCRSIST